MRTLRGIVYATCGVLIVLVLAIPALFALCLEEVAHKKGDEQ